MFVFYETIRFYVAVYNSGEIYMEPGGSYINMSEYLVLGLQKTLFMSCSSLCAMRPITVRASFRTHSIVTIFTTILVLCIQVLIVVFINVLASVIIHVSGKRGIRTHAVSLKNTSVIKKYLNFLSFRLNVGIVGEEALFCTMAITIFSAKRIL